MSSTFINLACALPEGNDEAASALFHLGKASLKEAVHIPSNLNEDVVRAARRGSVAEAVTAVKRSTSPKALATHQGDSRVSVQRALAQNEHTPAATLSWLWKSAIRRRDEAVIGEIAHRIPLDELFGSLAPDASVWHGVQHRAIVEKALEAGHEQVQLVAEVRNHTMQTVLLAVLLETGNSFEWILEKDSRPDRLLAHACQVMGLVNKAAADWTVRSDPREFVSTVHRMQSPRIELPEWNLLAGALDAGQRRTPEQLLVAAFEPTESTKKVFIEGLLTITDHTAVERGMKVLHLCDADEVHLVVEHVAPTMGYHACNLLSTLPRHADQRSRDTILQHLGDHGLRSLLRTRNVEGLSGADIAAIMSSEDQARYVANIVWDYPMNQMPWFDVAVELAGSRLYSSIASNPRAAQWIAQHLAEKMKGNPAGIVLAARLIHEGFTGSFSELIAAALVLHPNPVEIDTAESVVDSEENAQLELFA
jgi:hypothetical protein